MHASARKIPQLRVLAALLLWSTAYAGGAQAQDSTSIFRAAHAAEAEYERAARRLAPFAYATRSGSCDEYVGRFCLYYDTGRDPLPPEPPAIARVRERAIAQLQTAFALNHARTATVLPLVRLLLEHKRPQDALTVARQYRETSGDRVTANLLVVLALHASADIPGAERVIDDLLAVSDSSQRRRLRDISTLLGSPQRKRYRALSSAAAAAFETRFWRYADALYLTDGNEVRTEHFARHAENRLLEAAPVVLGSNSFGEDVGELTIRFGTPKARTRTASSTPGTYDLQITEHWDPEQMIYAAPDLDSVLRVRPRAGSGWPMDTVRSISGHAPSTIRRMLPMEHQASVFRDSAGQSVLRVDGVLVADSASRGAGYVRRGVFLLDDSLRVVSRLIDQVVVARDTFPVQLELPLPENAAFYSAELLEPASRLAGRARFPIERPLASGSLYLSDVVITKAFPPGHPPDSRRDRAFAPRGTLLFPVGEAFGVYAEMSLGRAGPDSVQVELELLSVDGSPALVRAARWVGERLGLADRPVSRRIAWRTEVRTAAPTPLAVTVESANLKPGRYLIDLVVIDGERRVASRREIVLTA